MSISQIEIQIIAVLVSISCAILGVFLVLRKTAMISDAISHSILPVIVIGFFITEDLQSPLLIILAAFTGMLTVFLVAWLIRTNLVKEDTSIGIVFPVLFSIGIILITQKASDIHLDTDVVLLGELAFAPFNRLFINDIDLGPKAIWVMGGIFLILISLLALFYKELKLSTFDAGLATTLGFSPLLIHYSIMLLSSITIVGAFDAVGSILVVGLIIVPAGIAYLLSYKLKNMLIISVLSAGVCAILGYWLAHILNTSIAGSIIAVLGFVFLIAYLFSPLEGRITRKIRHRQQSKEISLLTLLIHLQSHQEKSERRVSHLQEHINWSAEKANRILKVATQKGFINISEGLIDITTEGINFSIRRIEYYLKK